MAKVLHAIVVLAVFVVTNSAISHWHWSDCGDPSTAYVTFRKFDILPKPMSLPGLVNVTIAGSVQHEITTDVTLNVTVTKYLLSRWTKMPCNNRLGSCNYDNPCEFLQVFETNGTCPVALSSNGLPCTCPFHTANDLNMPYSTFNISSVRPEYQWILDGRFKMDVNMYKKNSATSIGCFQLEFDSQAPCSGFFCGG